MYKIVKKKSLNPTVTLMEIDAPLIAKKAEPGQFIILRVDENGERIPLTVAGYDSTEQIRCLRVRLLHMRECCVDQPQNIRRGDI